MPLVRVMRYGHVHNPDTVLYRRLPDFKLSPTATARFRESALSPRPAIATMLAGVADFLHYREPGRRGDELLRTRQAHRSGHMRRGARVVQFLAIVVAIVFAVTACAPEDAATSPGYVSGDGTVTILAEADSPVIALTGTSYDGVIVDIADYHGKVVLINTWYAACPPCRAEAPELVALDARDDVQLVGVNGRDDAGTAQAFERNFSVPYPTIDDADGAAVATLQGLIAINAVPTTLVVDPQGRVYARVIGRTDFSTLEALVEEAAGQA